MAARAPHDRVRFLQIRQLGLDLSFCPVHGEETETLFRLSREIRALLGQIREDDIQASLRLRVEQEQILDQIRTANQGGKAKGARFYSAAAARSRGGSRLGNA